MSKISKIRLVSAVATIACFGIVTAQAQDTPTSCGKGSVYDSASGTCVRIKGGRSGFDLQGTGDSQSAATHHATARHHAMTKPADALASVPPAASDAGQAGIGANLTFGYNSADLTDADQQMLQKLAGELLDPAHAHDKVKLDGYADAVGSAQYNKALSRKRAVAAKAGLVAHGVSEDRIETAALGSEHPIDPSNPTAAENRRVVATTVR